MDLEKDDFRNIIDDTRTRHAAVVSLIYFTDSQALGLFRLYVTMAIATASGAAAVFAGSAVPRAAGWALGSATLMLLAGIWFCIQAMRSMNISLPGRGPDFWLWASRPDVSRDAILKAYLENLAIKTKTNAEINRVNGPANQSGLPAVARASPLAVFGMYVAHEHPGSDACDDDK